MWITTQGKALLAMTIKCWITTQILRLVLVMTVGGCCFVRCFGFCENLSMTKFFCGLPRSLHSLAMTEVESMLTMTAWAVDCYALDFAKTQKLIAHNDDGRVDFAFATAITRACMLKIATS